MIGGIIHITGGAKQMAQALPKVMKDALKRGLVFWHGKHLPRHFEHGAAGRYHYKRRTSRWRKRKRAKFGHALPLVYTGRLMREVTQTINISGTSKQARGGLRGPKYLYAFQIGRGPDKAKEILATTRGERDEIAKEMDRVITDRMKCSPRAWG